VTVPFALLGAALGWLIVPKTAVLAEDRRFDSGGALILVPALVALLLAITEAPAWGLTPPFVVAVVAALILLGLFVWRECRAPAPLIRLRLFRSPAFSAGAVGVLVSYGLLYGMFFAMSFALVRGYHDPAVAAGLRLTIVPLALGIVAPFSGALYELRPRLVMLGGMAVCIAAVLALTATITGGPRSLPGVMIALAAFGAGLGIFIAPNNSATIASAPADRSGEAGGLLNLMRSFGTGVGVAAASSLLAWRLEMATGVAERTIGVAKPALLAAVGDVMLMLATFAIIAGAASMLRARPERPTGSFVVAEQARQRAAG
jgi:Major Facilitator Superfamily